MLGNYQKISLSSQNTIFRVLRQISYTKLFKKYSSGNFSYHKILANNLVFNDTCRIVARFKDYLILDDNSEFLRRFYGKEESNPRLNKILNFYETYSKIFPNYMILKESKYLYRNIRKKQKMIDAVNEIKREEEENRKKMKQNIDENNKNKNELFTKKVKEEIKIFQENTTFQRYNNNFDSDNDDNNENSISISIVNKKMFENMDNNFDTGKEIDNGRNKSIQESFVTNETNHSISGILNILNDNKIYIKDLPQLLELKNKSKNTQKKKANNIATKTKRDSNNMNDLKKTKNKQMKLDNSLSHQYQINKNTYTNSSNIFSNINSNYITTKGELKNINEINQFQNIIIPKGNTVININNNYFEQQTPTSLCQMRNYKINKNTKQNNINYKYNSTLKKSSTNNNHKNNNNQELSENKNNQQQRKYVKTVNNEDKNNSPKNNIYIYKNRHKKQISQDYIYQKVNSNNEGKIIKEKVIKFDSLSPSPAISKFNSNYKNKINSNYLSENNNPNLITTNTRTNENENDYIERNRLLLYIRDAIEKNKKENKDNYGNKELYEGNNLYSNKNDKINNKNKKNENNHNYTNFSRYKTITNFKSECKDYSNILKNEQKLALREKCFSKKDILNPIVQISKNKSKNKKENKYKKLQIRDKKNKAKGNMKNNKLYNSNYNTTNNTNSKEEKDKNFFKTNNNFKNNKNLFEKINKENSMIKSNEKQNKKSQRILSLNNQTLKSEKDQKNNFTEKGSSTLSQSLLFKNTTNSQLSNLLMSHKKENQCFTEANNNTTTKIYHKSKIKKMVYKKDNLSLNKEMKPNEINSICYSNKNNYYTEKNNDNNNIILADIYNSNENINSNQFRKIDNSELRYKYKNFMLKKNKIKSCEFEKQSDTQDKNNKILIDRMTLLSQNPVNSFYHNFLENKPNFLINSQRIENISSYENTNFNSKFIYNSKGKKKNDNTGVQTPSVGNKKIGLYKKVVNKQSKLIRTEKKEENKRTKNFITPGAIKVNRSKFLKDVKNKIYDNYSKIRTKK